MIMVPKVFSRRDAVAALGGTASYLAGLRASRSEPVKHAPIRRGVNLSHWLAQSYEGTSSSHYAHFVDLARLRQLARLGFDHGRLSVDPSLLFATAGAPAIDSLQRGYLHAALDKIEAAGLDSIVDLHPVGASKNVLLSPEGAARFVTNWRLLAADLKLRGRKPILEILNEPAPLAGETWWDLQGRALAAIREGDPDARAIANGGGWSGVDDLVAHRPYDDANVVYTVHYYEPMLFTHQATTWSWDVAQRVKQLSWPIPPVDAAAAAAAATHDDVAEKFVRDAVAGDHFTRAAMMETLTRLRAWQHAHGDCAIYVGEFGVYAKSAPTESRLAWLSAARGAFEDNGWGWAIWDMSADFGFETRQNGRIAIDMATVNALGLGA